MDYDVDGEVTEEEQYEDNHQESRFFVGFEVDLDQPKVKKNNCVQRVKETLRDGKTKRSNKGEEVVEMTELDENLDIWSDRSSFDSD